MPILFLGQTLIHFLVAQPALAETHCFPLVTIRTPIRYRLSPFTAMRSVPSSDRSVPKPPTFFDDDGLPSLKINIIIMNAHALSLQLYKSLVMTLSVYDCSSNSWKLIGACPIRQV